MTSALVQVAHVVELQPGRAPGHAAGIGQPAVAASADLEIAAVAAERGALGIEAQVAAVRALEIVGRRFLGAQQRFPAAVDQAEHGVERDIIAAVLPAVVEIDAGGVGRLVQEIQGRVPRSRLTAVTMAPMNDLPFIDVLLGAQHEVVGQRLHGRVAVLPVQAERGPGAAGQAFQHPERQAARGLARDLEGAQDGRGHGHVQVFPVPRLRGVLRGAADAPRIEQVVAAEVAVAAHDAEVEDVPALR